MRINDNNTIFLTKQQHKIPENNVFLRNITKSGILQKGNLNGHVIFVVLSLYLKIKLWQV